jgi:hypothetical protein
MVSAAESGAGERTPNAIPEGSWIYIILYGCKQSLQCNNLPSQ